MKGAFSYFDGERATRHNLKPRPPGNNPTVSMDFALRNCILVISDL